MKLAALMTFICSATGAPAHAADVMDLLSLKEVAIAQERTDGYYDVICANGNREKVSSSDIRYNDICPNSRSSTMTNMQSVQKRRDGMFDIICRDSTKAMVNAQQILNNDVCIPVENPVVLEDGVYGSPGRSDGTIRAKHSAGRLVGLHVEIVNLKSDMTCHDNVCSGSFPGYAQTFYIKVLSRTSFEFSYDNNQSVRVFTKKN